MRTNIPRTLAACLIFAIFMAPQPLGAVAEATSQEKIIPQEEYSSWWSAVFPRDQDEEKIITEKTDLLIRLLDLSARMPFDQKINFIRFFINKNSIHKIDDEFYSYWHDMTETMSRIGAHVLTAAAPSPHMECSSRSVVMYRILDRLNIRARIVVLRAAENVMDSHTMVEVLNPETRRWEIQDPDNNIYWIFNDGSGRRADAEDMLTYPMPAGFLPCRDDDDCGYTDNERAMPRLFAYANLLDIQKNDNILLVSKTRFGLDHPFLLRSHDTLSYCTLFGDKCRSKLIGINEKPASPDKAAQ